MIGVLVGDEDGGERFGIVAGRSQALEGFLAGQAGVD
jgi:hypothetical protein